MVANQNPTPLTYKYWWTSWSNNKLETRRFSFVDFPEMKPKSTLITLNNYKLYFKIVFQYLRNGLLSSRWMFQSFSLEISPNRLK